MPRTGRRPGESGTRERIAQVARRQFAERGFDRTSIRGVAAAAKVDPALVLHYFGTKERLFLSVLELPFDPATQLAEVMADGPDGAGERLVRFLLALWESDVTGPTMRAIARSATSDAAATGVAQGIVSGVFETLAAGLGVPDADQRVALAASQLFGLALARYVVGLEPLASADHETLVAAVAPTIQRYLTGDLGEA